MSSRCVAWWTSVGQKKPALLLTTPLVARRAARPEPLAILPCTSLLLSRCRLCARFASWDRSHSQAVSACGWPNTFRKYGAVEASRICVARVPAGSPLKFCEVLVT